MVQSMTDKYCIIGGGASGIAAAKNFVERNIPFDLLEREKDLGGLWNINTPSGIVYESTHLVSCISSTGFDDFPMLDEDYVEYPSHDIVLDYFRKYVDKFKIGPHLQFNSAVESVTPEADGTFLVKVKGEASPRRYRGVVVANGHHEQPRMPSYPGTFTGEVMHSKYYKGQRQLRDKRILVVGAGNSACDIVKDAAYASGEKVIMSMRHGTWFIPKFLLGIPTGDILSNVEWALAWVPRTAKAYLFQSALWLLQGPPSRYRLPDPTYRIDQAHPSMSDDIPRLAAHGRIHVKPDVARFEGKEAVFTDGTREEIDLVIYATGYQLAIPFLDRSLYLGADGRPNLYLNAFHPTYENLYFCGMLQANGAMWRLADYQSKIIANDIVAMATAPDEHAAFRAEAKTHFGEKQVVTYIESDRHMLERNYYDFARLLKQIARKFPKAGRLNLPVTRPAPDVRAAAAE